MIIWSCLELQELWSLLEFMMPDVFDTNGVDLDQYLGTRNATSGVVVQDTNLMTRIKGILGPFVLRRMKTDVMRQLVSKIQEVRFPIGFDCRRDILWVFRFSVVWITVL
jgi:SWI/SNF-related matrix-associated actin-dependent regulator 1 of chromatin subfamily A